MIEGLIRIIEGLIEIWKKLSLWMKIFWICTGLFRFARAYGWSGIERGELWTYPWKMVRSELICSDQIIYEQINKMPDMKYVRDENCMVRYENWTCLSVFISDLIWSDTIYSNQIRYDQMWIFSRVCRLCSVGDNVFADTGFDSRHGIGIKFLCIWNVQNSFRKFPHSSGIQL